jgi:hypothetical protein
MDLRGRPTVYTQELADLICNAVSSDIYSIRQLCEKNASLPPMNTIYNWLRMYPDFNDKYLKAKALQAHILVDEMVEISDDPANCVSEIMQWAKVRIDTRKWMAQKLLPRLYGDKQQTEHSVSDSTKEVVKRVADINKENEKAF